MSTQAEPARIIVAERNLPRDPELTALARVDLGFDSRVVTASSAEHTRLVLTPVGSLLEDTDDVRKVGEAAGAGAMAAMAMGATELTLEVDPAIEEMQHYSNGQSYRFAMLVAQLGVLQRASVPLMAREFEEDHDGTNRQPRLEKLVAIDTSGKHECVWHKRPLGAAEEAAGLLEAIEAGRSLARDVGSADPERMAPLRVAEYVSRACTSAGIGVEIISDVAALAAEYPLLMAVARASIAVKRHRPCVVRLTWQGSGLIRQTLCIAGKGVTYDTGGADLKVGGSMAGMRRDKCGAAGAAGFILACAKASPELTAGLRVVVELGCVRNSVGSDAYVADEIIRGHSGKRVLIGNTDAEGRLVLADLLSHLRERTLLDHSANPAPRFLSIGTLTGHAVRSFGPYAAAIDSAAAKAVGGLAPHIAAAGALLGQPMEVSSLRREDFAFIAPGCSNTSVSASHQYDVLQSNNLPTSVTARGHQFPMAFLIVASGLQEHSARSGTPLPYCHIDLANSVVDTHGVETGSPILPLFAHFVMQLDNTPMTTPGSKKRKSQL